MIEKEGPRLPPLTEEDAKYIAKLLAAYPGDDDCEVCKHGTSHRLSVEF